MRPTMPLLSLMHCAAALALAGCASSQNLPCPACAAHTDWQAYPKVMLDPIAVQPGDGNTFEGLTDSEQEALALYMDARFGDALNETRALVNWVSPGTLRLKLTLTGATAPARNGDGMAPCVSYAVEMRDASSQRLLMAYATRQCPGPLQLPAGAGTMAAAEAGLRTGAKELAQRLQ